MLWKQSGLRSALRGTKCLLAMILLKKYTHQRPEDVGHDSWEEYS